MGLFGRMALKHVYYHVRNMGLVHWDDPEGWDVEEGGRGVQDGEHVCTMADSC